LFVRIRIKTAELENQLESNTGQKHMNEAEQAIDTEWHWQRKAQTSLQLPNCYMWLIAVGTLDILFTTIILSLGGSEANPIAAAVITAHGLPGMVVFKYLSIGLIVLCCEYVARTRIQTARRLALLVVAISAAPVIWSSGLLVTIAV
jgi:hypothetical protein